VKNTYSHPSIFISAASKSVDSTNRRSKRSEKKKKTQQVPESKLEVAIPFTLYQVLEGLPWWLRG